MMEDYVPTISYDIFMKGCEISYYLMQKGYYKIEPWWNGECLTWYLIQGEKKTKISLKGNSPEYYFNDTILKNNRLDEDKEYNNCFIVNGVLNEDEEMKKDLEIYKWWLIVPYAYNNHSVMGSESGYGFNHTDIEQGIYKTYH